MEDSLLSLDIMIDNREGEMGRSNLFRYEHASWKRERADGVRTRREGRCGDGARGLAHPGDRLWRASVG